MKGTANTLITLLFVNNHGIHLWTNHAWYVFKKRKEERYPLDHNIYNNIWSCYWLKYLIGTWCWSGCGETASTIHGWWQGKLAVNSTPMNLSSRHSHKGACTKINSGASILENTMTLTKMRNRAYTRHCFKCFVYINSFNPHSNSQGQSTLQMSKLWGERFSNLPGITQLASARIWTHTVWLQSLSWKVPLKEHCLRAAFWMIKERQQRQKLRRKETSYWVVCVGEFQ